MTKGEKGSKVGDNIMPISTKVKESNKLYNYLVKTNTKITNKEINFDKFGAEGVEALKSVTPIDTGLTSNSWYYNIVRNKTGVSIQFCNSNLDSEGVPIVILLQYGHATKEGYYIQGRNFINPVIEPLFQRIAEEAWKEVCG